MVIDFQSVSFSYCECNDFFTVKKGIPTDEELEKLSVDIGEAWKSLGRRLKIDEALLTGFDRENDEYREKSYKMLLHWRNRQGSLATYQIHDALCHELVNRKDFVVSNFELCRVTDGV